MRWLAARAITVCLLDVNYASPAPVVINCVWVVVVIAAVVFVLPRLLVRSGECPSLHPAPLVIVRQPPISEP